MNQSAENLYDMPPRSFAEIDASLGKVLLEMDEALTQTDAAVDEADAALDRMQHPFRR